MIIAIRIRQPANANIPSPISAIAMDDAVFVNFRRKSAIVTAMPPDSDLVIRLLPHYAKLGFSLTTWSAIRSRIKTEPCSWEILPLLAVPTDFRFLIEGDVI